MFKFFLILDLRVMYIFLNINMKNLYKILTLKEFIYNKYCFYLFIFNC